jgi:hypothetical protein
MDDFKASYTAWHLKELDDLRLSHAVMLTRLAEDEKANAKKH